ncbi:ABC transporter ATP-binding protein [Streptomyces endophyticus]|uniref:ABC transporter ATP-binding protein n=1 Tax=Streptomyces endophyticus TaxID=714166 RepID=A0ABU6FHH2_9ACTN|nr:ABC transporter ATP-binding protein [Streptomyces endophyticus]MEB8343493.1 ABC transporter ATP-binding protein [Streptomyces endophyticus]
MSTSPLLSAAGLTKAYGKTPALRGVDLDVRPGEFLAVTGASGSGKSTLLHCMAGIVRPDEGTVTYGDTRLDTLGEERRSDLRRTEFGIVFQFGQLVPELTALDNVALPLLLAGTSRSAARAEADAWLERFGVRGQRELRPGEMSGGQTQRAALARALVTQPKVVFADEPTGALDSLATEQVLTSLTHACRETHTAVVLVTHEAQVAAYAEREVCLRDGTVHGLHPTAPPASAEVAR